MRVLAQYLEPIARCRDGGVSRWRGQSARFAYRPARDLASVTEANPAAPRAEARSAIRPRSPSPTSTRAVATRCARAQLVKLPRDNVPIRKTLLTADASHCSREPTPASRAESAYLASERFRVCSRLGACDRFGDIPRPRQGRSRRRRAARFRGGCRPPPRSLTPPRRPRSDQRGRAARRCGAAKIVRKRQRRGLAKVVVGVLSDPPILAFSLSIGKGLMTISMPDRFRLAAPRGRRRRIGLAIGLLEQSRLASCRRPGRTKSTRLTRRRIAVWRLEWPPRVPRARRDGRDGSCANGRPRDVGHRCERWRASRARAGCSI